MFRDVQDHDPATVTAAKDCTVLHTSNLNELLRAGAHTPHSPLTGCVAGDLHDPDALTINGGSVGLGLEEFLGPLVLLVGEEAGTRHPR